MRPLRSWPFLALPVAFAVVWVACLVAHGPSWLGLNSDPDFAYLLNALNLASGEPSGFGGHPGTPVEIIGAIVLRAAHPFLDSSALAENVFADPERYLLATKLLMAISYVGALAFVGLRTWSLTGSTVAGILSQASPHLAAAAIENTLQVKPEPLQLSLAALLFVVALGASHAADARAGAKLGLVFGTLLAAKVTSAPLLILCAVVLNGWRARAIFAGTCVATVGVLTAPAWQALGALVRIMVSIGTHTGAYGHGDPGLFDPVLWAGGLWFVVSQSPAFDFAVAAAATSLVVRRRGGAAPAAPDRSLVGAIVATMAISAFMVARHPVDLRYLVPGLALVGPCLALTWVRLDLDRFRRARLIALSAVALAGIFVAIGAYRQLDRRRREQLEAAEFVTTRSASSTPVYSYGASSLAYAFYFGNAYAGGRYTRLVAQRFPRAVYFDPWTERVDWLGFGRPPGPPAIVFGLPLNDSVLRDVSGDRPPVLANGSAVVYEIP